MSGRKSVRTVMDAQLGVEISDVRFDGSAAEKQLIRDFLGGRILGKKRQDILFAGRQLDGLHRSSDRDL